MIEIGSSDAPAILGVSPFLTPWQCWAQAVGLIERRDETNEVMEWGTRLEGVVLDATISDLRPGAVSVRAPFTRSYHEDRKWQRSTADAILIGLYGEHGDVFECKCVVGQPPPTPRVEWVVQALHHLLVNTGADRCYLVAFGGLRAERWIIPRHQGALDRVLRAEEAFLELVQKEIPPPVRAEDSPGLWRGWPLVRDEVRVLPVDAIEWDAQMVEAGATKEAAEQRYEEARAKIKAAMGECIKAALPDGSGTTYKWAPDKRGVRGLRRGGQGTWRART